VPKLNRRAIKATDILPWPSTWVIRDRRSGQYLMGVGVGQGISTRWCAEIEDALQLNGSDVIFLTPRLGNFDEPMDIIQCPEDC
jgi:hypothetical protein